MSKEMLELAGRLERQARLRCLGLDTQELLQQAAAALRASAVAEPVAWRWRRKNDTGGFGEWHVTEARPNGEVYDLTPLPHPAPAAPVPASVREALELAQSAFREQGISDRVPITLGRIERALAFLPAPAAAPTREETIEQCAKVCNRWIKSKNVHESLAADDIAKAILALKAAPAK